MNRFIFFKLFFLFAISTGFAQVAPDLQSLNNFTVLAGTQITSVGNTVVSNKLGISPGSTLTGFPPGIIAGGINDTHLNDLVAQTAQVHLTAAYNQAAAQTPTSTFPGGTVQLGGQALQPGVYRINGNALLNGNLNLNLNPNNTNSVFVFQITGDLNINANAKIILGTGIRSGRIFWQIGNSVTIGAGADVKGTIMASQNITMGNNAILKDGRLLARNGFVNLDNNPLTTPTSSDLSVKKTIITPAPYFMGMQVVYKIVVKNLGPAAETNIVVNDQLPGALINPVSNPANAYNPTTGNWLISSLANGASDSITITATVNGTNFIFNSASVAGNGIDDNQSNNTSTVSICVVPPQPGVISGPSVFCVGTFGNTYSISPVPGVTNYTWSVPANWSIVSGQGTTSVNLIYTGTDTASAIIAVTANYTCGGSTPSIKKVVALPPPALLPNISGNIFPCQNSIGVSYSIPPQYAIDPTTGYSWTVPAGWSITSGQGTNHIIVSVGNSPGVISVVTSNSCGTSQPKNLNVTPVASPPASPGPISPPFAGSPCVGQVSLTYSVPGSPNTTNYIWTVPPSWTIVSGQGTTSIIVTVGSTNGTVSVIGSNGCGNGPSSTLVVNPATAPPVTAGPINGEYIPCVGQTSVTYSVPTQIGTYNWTVPNGWTIVSGQGTNTITVNIGSTAGTVNVTVSNGCGTSSASTAVVTPSTTVPPSPASIIGGASGSPCAGQTNLTYTVVPVSGASSFVWTVPAGWVITAGQGTPSITVTAGSTAGPISVVAANGCGSSTATTLALTPTTTPPNQPGAIAGNTIPCAGSTTNVYNIPVVSGATNYTWAVPAGWTITAGQGTTTITVTAGTTNGVISVTASNGCGASLASTLPVISATTVPAAPGAITGTVNLCVNQTGLTYSITSVPNASGYTWSVPSGWTITSGQGTISITVNAGTNGGTVSVAATNGCGAGTASTVALVPVTTPPVSPGAITGNSVPCTGQSNVTYAVANMTGVSSYAWTVPSGWVITSGQGTNTITVTTSGTSGNISVSGVNSCGTGTSTSLQVNPTSSIAPAPGAISGNTVPCIGQTNVTYSIATVVGASSYNWTLPTGWIITSGQGTTAIQVTVGSTSGNVSVTAANGCGTGVASVLILTPALNPPSAPGAINGNSVPCTTGGDVTYSIAPVSNASSYTWTTPTGWNIVSGQGTTSITVAPGSIAGNISVVANNGCGASSATTLNVMISPVAPTVPGPITAAFNGSPCVGQTGVKFSIVPVAGASSYLWNIPTGSGWTITSGQGTEEIEVTVGSSPGSVTVTAVNGCGSSQVSTLVVTPTSSNPATSGVISGPIVPCTGNVATTYTTSSANATSFIWSVPAGWAITSGQGTTQITVTPDNSPGIITVVASNSCGAGIPSTLSVTPTSTVPPVTGSIAGNVNICSNELNLAYSVVAVTGATSYNWTVPAGWSIISGQGTTDIVVNAGITGGDINVTAVNDCGASSASTLNVNIRPSLVISGTINDESSPCNGLKYSVSPVAGATTYEWTVPQGWQIISGVGTTTIQVIANSDTGTVSVSAQNASCKSEPVKASAKASLANVDLDVPNAFSPNSDGINELWEVKNLGNYPDNDLTIINRWGNEVYKQKSYKNNWNGGELSAGTYYYILRVKLCNNEEKTLKGFVMVVR